MNRKRAFTLVEIMIVVAIIGILLAIAVPSFFRAREVARRNSCQSNLKLLDAAKTSAAMEKNLNPSLPCDWALLLDNEYVKKSPRCPSIGVYTLGTFLEDPTCSLSTGAAFAEYNHTFPGASS